MHDQRMAKFSLASDRFRLGEKLQSGVWGTLYRAVDSETGGMVAIRVVAPKNENLSDVVQEHEVLNHLPPFDNILNYIGTFKKQERGDVQLMVVSEQCDGMSLGAYVRAMVSENKRLPEDHISYILRELLKGVVHCHENNVIHRNIRADNIFLTSDGVVKLGNFAISSRVEGPESKLMLRIGSPSWLSPEVASGEHKENLGYDLRADVWAVGITAIELGDGKPPLQGLHPTRALFQIVRNPPPSLYRPGNWSQLYNDFITECLEKSPENRPHAQELIEHPFFEGIEEKMAKIKEELSGNVTDMKSRKYREQEENNTLIRGKLLEQPGEKPQKLIQEDIAALEDLSEETVTEELIQRAKQDNYYTFVGDILVSLNPNKELNLYGEECQEKYKFKARSDNAPHIYSVADKAYQDVLHNEEPQHIIMAGETMSGKTANRRNVVDHLLFLGKGHGCIENIKRAFSVIDALGNAGTTQNADSTRHILQTQITYTTTGKVSGAIYWMYLLEKTRITMRDSKHSNFHIFYYFYDSLEANDLLSEYKLAKGRSYKYLRNSAEANEKLGPRETPERNPKKWTKFVEDIVHLGAEEASVDIIKKALAAILLLGEVEFTSDGEGFASISNPDIVENVSDLLGLDFKKFSWAMLNYCVVEKGEATRRHHKVPEASEARDVLAQGLYSRLVDWIICKINEQLTLSRIIFGDRRFISVTDLFGFECYTKNTLQQLFVNSVNEQLQYYYNQKIFVWEAQDGEEEEIPVPNLPYYDNKLTIDQLLAKPNGLMYTLDEASRANCLSVMKEKMRNANANHITLASGNEFAVAHYTGRVNYDASEFLDKNRDFLPPEMIETMRRSSDKLIQTLFTGLFSKSGNLTIASDPELAKNVHNRWDAALVAESEKLRVRKYNTESRGQYSQSRQMRTASASFRGTCLELLKSLAGSCGVHFVRCIRTCLSNDPPGSIQTDLVKQQVKAMGIADAARARRRGYSARIPFQEFIRRYQFLAFEFDEPVEVTKDNCRLLLIRLKMEGWVIGKTKVFLKYHNEEYLSRLFETQVKKIVKIQAMMRAFLAKRAIAKLEVVGKSDRNGSRREHEMNQNKKELTPDEAATVIQKQIRGVLVRKEYGARVDTAIGKFDEATILFMRKWWKRWQVKSIFQVLLLYRATRHQDLVYFCQQSHLYNQNAISLLQDVADGIQLESVNPKINANTFLPKAVPSVHKLPFRLSDLSYFDSTYLCDPARTLRYKKTRDSDENWDAPLQRHIGEKYSKFATGHHYRDEGSQTDVKVAVVKCQNNLPITPFIREQSKGAKFPPEREEFPIEYGKSQVYRSSKPVQQKKVTRSSNTKQADQSYNPVREMQDMFRHCSIDEDEPPFNFRAMLKKTNPKRESLKRLIDDGEFLTAENNNNNVVYKSPSRIKENKNNFNNNITNNTNINNSNNDVGKDYRGYKAGKASSKSRIDILELAPGLILQGEVADL